LESWVSNIPMCVTPIPEGHGLSRAANRSEVPGFSR
jgi:hypothetical protein